MKASARAAELNRIIARLQHRHEWARLGRDRAQERIERLGERIIEAQAEQRRIRDAGGLDE